MHNLYSELFVMSNELFLDYLILIIRLCIDILKFRSKSPFATFCDLTFDNKESKIPTVPHVDDDPTVDDEVLGMEPLLKQRPR